MKIVEQIKSLIKAANETDSVRDLIEINMKINGYLVFMCELESSALNDKLAAYNERKEFEAMYTVKFDGGVTRGEKEAIAASKKQRGLEIATEVTYQKMRGFRTQVNEFCQALTQKIANLRREIETSKLN